MSGTWVKMIGRLRHSETTSSVTAGGGPLQLVCYFSAVLKNSMMGRSYASSCSPVAASTPPPVSGRSFLTSTVPPVKQADNANVELRHGSLVVPARSKTFSLRVARANSHAEVF